ncbi:MAG: hypothetical protein ACR2IT_08930 [Pirellulales bacterium]
MRHGTGSPIPTGLVAIAFIVGAAVAAGRPAVAQNSFWGWGLTGNPTTTWSP